ncbi:hypothetical protein NGRA_1478 [Nosema granulosis]|uniref:Uncharacterized protein n=1 Tax=Nosema granulosis TaxID=83296 RepID=A0A9P6KZB6_9MICR|nr:hypothetical protein NGRA_1478 [Nosema granulosis]
MKQEQHEPLDLSFRSSHTQKCYQTIPYTQKIEESIEQISFLDEVIVEKEENIYTIGPSYEQRDKIHTASQTFTMDTVNNIEDNQTLNLERIPYSRSIHIIDSLKRTLPETPISSLINSKDITLNMGMHIFQNLKVFTILNDLTTEYKPFPHEIRHKFLDKYLKGSFDIGKSTPIQSQFFYLTQMTENILKNIFSFLGESYLKNIVCTKDSDYIKSALSIYEGFNNLELLRSTKKYLIFSDDLKRLNEKLNNQADVFLSKGETMFNVNDYYFFYRVKIDEDVIRTAPLDDLICLLLIEIIKNKRDIHNLSSLLFIAFLDNTFLNQKYHLKIKTSTQKDLIIKAIALLKISSKEQNIVSIDKINKIFVDIFTRYLNREKANEKIQKINKLIGWIMINESDEVFNNTYTHDNIVFLYNLLDNRNNILKKISEENIKKRNYKFFSFHDQLSICLFRKCCKLLNCIRYTLISHLQIRE